ncbi:hypothetical protein [Prochlorococcus sp. MIT 1307]|uniref:hypothetical protein n=1 Tax=Prochlorococcus sp. MIT 1307 TaxID=3096219 RepID=UPI002A752C9D|nr:hypothetical protein [Prochlorococcus sp. MIT 1307]
MPFFQLLVANASVLEQSMPSAIKDEPLIQEMQVAPEPKIEVIPFVIEGSVESFDSIERAKEIAKTLARKWCGTYSSFNDGSKLDLTLFFSQVKPIGQIVVLHGEVLIDGVTTSISGNINARSNQIELILISNQLIAGIEPGGTFLGLDGIKSLAWKPSRLNDSGGRLDFKNTCSKVNSKAQSVFTFS